jgi:hypothetical protein
MNCFKKSFWPWKLSDTVAHEDGKRNTIVWRFFCISGPSKLHGMGSESNISVLERLIGEEERLRWLVDGIFGEACCGVLTTSAFSTSTPCWLVLRTSLSSWTVPLGFSFFGLEESDMMRGLYLK